MIKVVVAILVLAQIALGLHSHLHPETIAHLLITRRVHLENEVADLYFEDEFTNMKTLIDYVSRALTQNDSKKYAFLIGKTEEMQTRLSNLSRVLLKYHLPVTNSSALCPGVTTFNRTELRNEIRLNEESDRLAVQYLSTCLDCSFVSGDILQIQNLTNSYIQQVNRTLDGFYCNSTRADGEKPTGIVNLNSSYFKCNLKAKNWYYGSTTASDFKIYVFKRTASYNLTNCPIATPFVKDEEQICFNCPVGSIFNLGDQKCDTCKPNEILNIKSGRCDSCLGEKMLIQGELVCKLCILSQGQLFNETTGKCYRCGNDSYLDSVNKACTKINCNISTPRFDRLTKKCQACGPSEVIDPNDVAKCIKTNYIGLCPPSTPLYDTKTKLCVACPINTEYSKQANQCKQQTKQNHYSEASKTQAESSVDSCEEGVGCYGFDPAK